MLETKNLTKIYKPKKGVPVTALDNVSLKFSEKGMVFILGKSGSGKSTLLNVLGGLDSYNDGEILIKGVSSKTFKQKHFDSYRNTYVGFIFQEYNVLDDFSVGANIALAIELQGRKATDNELNSILEKVDLKDFAKRKPNELSGGQKQRVAIARALVKNPQIIMADEPSGALDSATGKQIFDTLKKLSSEKLVIVVSHDRDFAETYADRIIELADGKVISDVTVCENSEPQENEPMQFEGNTVKIESGYHITEEDRKKINEYIENIKSGVNLEISQTNKKRFSDTDLSKIVLGKTDDFKLIKSKLPLKNAFKIGASGLKHKKIRLVVTILLSCIAFGLFGLSDTFAAYNHIKTCTNSIIDTGVNYASLGKTKRVKDGNYEYFATQYQFNNKEIEKIEKETGTDFVGVYAPHNLGLEFDEYTNPEVTLTETDYSIYITCFNGFCEVNDGVLGKFGFKLSSGVLPDGTKNEIAISEYTCEIFKKTGFFDGTTEKDKDGNLKRIYIPINNSSDMLGKKIKLGGTEYTVSGIIDTNMDLSRYEDLTVEKKGQSTADELVDFALYGEFASEIGYSLSNVCFVGDGKIFALKAEEPPISNIYNGYVYFYGEGEDYTIDPMYITNLESALNQPIIWADTAKQSLSEKEIIITSDMLYKFAEAGDEAYQKYLSDAEEKYYESLYSDISDEEEMPEITSAPVYKPDSKTLAAAESKRTEAYKKVLTELKTCTFNGVNREKSNDYLNIDGYRVVGVIPITENNEKWGTTAVLCDSLYHDFTVDGIGDYNFIVGKMPQSKQEVKRLVSYCYDRDGKNIAYDLQNSVTFELDAVNTTVKELARIFLYIGLGFALFAALMLSNFIATSISYKKQEIGILRAIGSRSNDVFRIFFAESFIIAMINFVLSAVGVFAATVIINAVLRNEVRILITVLSFGVRQILLILAVSIFVAFVASYIPVKKIASKKPIDAIRDR